MRKLREERGASAVEFAIIASLLLMILFGTIQFGILLNRYQGLHAAGREGARLGSLTGTTRAQIVDRVKQSVSVISSDPSVWTDNCAANPPSFASPERGCIDVFVRENPGDAQANWQEFPNSGDKPCETPDGTAPAVIVQVFYRLRLEIPLWASPTMTVSGSGEFRCEL